MAVKPCRDCGAEVSTSATHCPKCGSRNPSMSSNTIVLLILIIVVCSIIAALAQ